VREEIQKAFAAYDTVVQQGEGIDTLMSGLETEIGELNKGKAEMEASWEALRLLLEKFSSESIDLLTEMLNKGVKAIFTDRNYEIEIEITDAKKKQMKIYLLEERDGEIVRSLIPDGIGGGILVVLSFIFQVFLIRLYNLRPLILLDEQFTHISQSYLPNFMEFMRYLIAEMDFKFLWISHDERILPYFDRIYDVNMGKATLQR